MAVILTSAAGSGDPAVAYRHAFWWSVGLTALAVPLCLLLPGRPDATTAQQPAVDLSNAAGG